MGKKKSARARKAAARRRRQRRMILMGALAVALLAVVLIVLLTRPKDMDVAAERAPEAALTGTPEATATPSPTPAPTPTPTPEPTPVPMDRPDVISFYQPEGKSYSPRVRMGDEYTGRWKKGEDIDSFEVIASDEDRLEGDFFGDIFGECWTRFSDAQQCNIGFALRYTLTDGSEIRYTMLSPDHIQHTEYIECWLYDDYHREPHKSYSHIKRMTEDTLITSIKLTCGKKIKEVQEIWLQAFIYASLDEFDAERNYIGPTSCTLHILRAE